MLCKFSLLRRKEVINLCDGCRLGCVGDVEVTVPEGSVKALIVFGPCRFFGLFAFWLTIHSGLMLNAADFWSMNR